jgi:hypothetical protein
VNKYLLFNTNIKYKYNKHNVLALKIDFTCLEKIDLVPRPEDQQVRTHFLPSIKLYFCFFITKCRLDIASAILDSLPFPQGRSVSRP